MGKFSYRPVRLDTGNMGKISHGVARKYAIKLYNQDLKIAMQHYDALKKARTTGVGAPPAQVPDMVPNPGNPLQFTKSEAPDAETQFVDVPLAPDGSSKYDPVIKTHEAMGDFHSKRGMAFWEAARLHTQLGMAVAKESVTKGAPKSVATDDADDDMPSANPGRLPSMFDLHPDATEHDPDKALHYHQTLHGEAILEAHHFRQFGEQVRAKLDSLDPEAPPAKRLRLQEVLDVTKSLYELYNNIAELHGIYADDFRDYLKRRADHTFGYDADNIRDNPPAHAPDPNPFTAPGPAIGTVAGSPDPV
jgi:hypothetical protein